MTLIDEMTVREAREYKQIWADRFFKAIESLSREYKKECGDYPVIKLTYIDVTEYVGTVQYGQNQNVLSGVGLT